MRTYEALFIIQPEALEDEVQTMANGVETLITDAGGAVVRSEIWGKRRLAYEVKGFQEGVYVLIRFESNPELVDKMEGDFRLNESVIRWLVVHFDPKTLRLEAEQTRRNEALAEQRAGSGGRDDDDDRPAARKEQEETPASV